MLGAVAGFEAFDRAEQPTSVLRTLQIVGHFIAGPGGNGVADKDPVARERELYALYVLAAHNGTGRDRPWSTSTGHRPFVQSAGDTPRPLAKLSEWVRFVRPVPKFLTECVPRAMIRVRAYFSAPRVSGSAGGRTVMAVQFFGETGPIRVPHRSVGTSEPGEEVVADLRDHEPPSPGQKAIIGKRLPKHRDTETDRVSLQ